MTGYADILAGAPPPVRGSAARAQIRALRASQGRRIAVIDDDPTGSQSVHGVSSVLVLDPREYAAGLRPELAECFILTNSRSLDEAEAVAVNEEVGRDLFAIEQELGSPVDVISRGDSTLRGHVIAETYALDRARRQVLGKGYDGVLLVPAMFEAGRVTAGDIHWAQVDGRPIPVGESEFARDRSFGYRASRLPDFLEERSGAAISASEVMSIGLTDIREGGPERISRILSRADGMRWFVVNATEHSDLEQVALGVLAAQADGVTLLARSGPSLCRALAGIEPREPLTGADLWADAPRRAGHGLVVVGSHMGLTSRQVQCAVRDHHLRVVEIDVRQVLDPAQRDRVVTVCAEQVVDALGDREVLVQTSRTLVAGGDAGESLWVARQVGAAVVETVRESLRRARPSWVIAKGGITSHTVAAQALGIRRGRVLGQLFDGMVSVLRAEAAPPEVVGIPYVVFPGNVGGDDALSRAIAVLRAAD